MILTQVPPIARMSGAKKPELPMAALMSMIPGDVEHAINLNLLGNKTVIDYPPLKKLILEHVGNEQPLTMDVGNVEDGGADGQCKEQESNPSVEQVHSVGGPVGVGKGKGRGAPQASY